jgi:hypothetical protein
MRLRKFGMDTSAGFTQLFLSHNHATLTGWRIARSQHVRLRQKWSFGNGSLRRLDMLPPHRSGEQEKHHRGVQQKRRNGGNTGAFVVLGAHKGSQMLDPVSCASTTTILHSQDRSISLFAVAPGVKSAWETGTSH